MSDSKLIIYTDDLIDAYKLSNVDSRANHYRNKAQKDFYLSAMENDLENRQEVLSKSDIIEHYGNNKYLIIKPDRFNKNDQLYLKARKGDKIVEFRIESGQASNNGNIISIENKIGNIRYRIHFENVCYKGFDNMVSGDVYKGMVIEDEKYLGKLSNVSTPIKISVEMFLADIGLQKIYVNPYIFLGFYNPILYPKALFINNQYGNLLEYYTKVVHPLEVKKNKVSLFLDKILAAGPADGDPYHIETDNKLNPPPPPPPPPPKPPIKKSEPDNLPKPDENDSKEDENEDDLPKPDIIDDGKGNRVDPNIDNIENKPGNTSSDIGFKTDQRLQFESFYDRLLSDIEKQIKLICNNGCECTDELNELGNKLDEIDKKIDDFKNNVKPQIPVDIVGDGEVVQEQNDTTDDPSFFKSLVMKLKNPDLWGLLIYMLLFTAIIGAAMALKKRINRDPVDSHKEIYR